MPLSSLGPVTLRDKDRGSERTGAQVYTTPIYEDSRLYQSSLCYISPSRVRLLKRDPTIQLARWAVLAPMIHTPWTYVDKRVGGKNSASQEMIDFLDENLTPIRDMFLMQAVFGALDHGWQPFEIVYKVQDGWTYIDNFKALLQDFTTILVYVNNGKFAGFRNETFEPEQAQDVLLPYAQITNFEVEGTDWYGYSVFNSLSPIQASWDAVEESSARYDFKIAGASYAVFYPVGKTQFRGQERPNSEIAQIIADSLIGSGVVTIPDEIQDFYDDTIDKETKGKWRIELIEAKGSNQSGFIDRQKYLDALKFRAFGFPERSIMEGTHGTKEEAGEHGDIALSIVDTRHRLICNLLNLYAVPSLIKINFGEKYAYSVGVEPAPLNDKQFAVVKDIYTRILQHPETVIREYQTFNTLAIKKLLNLPVNGEEANTEFLELDDPAAFQKQEQDKKTAKQKEKANA